MVVSIGERPSMYEQGSCTMSTCAEGLPAPGMHAAGLAVSSPLMAQTASTQPLPLWTTAGEMLAAASERNTEKGDARSGEKEAAGVL